MSSEVKSEAIVPAELEEFKGRSDAPFEVIQKGEALAKYPLSFSRKLKDNWDKACKLMEWKTADSNTDWRFFQVAKDPLAVVKTIQTKIIEKGGTLPRFGVDGKFGSETEKGLADALATTETVPTKEPVPIDKSRPAEASSSPRDPEAQKAWLREKTKEAIDAMPKVEARLDAASLSLDRGDLERFSDDGLMMSYQSRAKGFRESVMEGEPRLKPLGKLVDAVIPIVEEEVKKIDLSQIHNFDDLMRTLGSSIKGLEAKMDGLKDLVSEKELEAVIKNVKMEELLVFAMAAFNELAVVLVNHFAKDKENLERVAKILVDEGMVMMKKMGLEVNAPKVKVAVRDLNPAPEVQSPKGKIEIPYKEQKVELDLDTLTIAVADKKAQLVLPTGVEVKGVTVAPNGDLVLTAGVGSFTSDNTIPKADFETYLTKITTSTSGQTIPLGTSGASIVII